MAIDTNAPNNIQLGSCEVFFGATSLGLTKGGVTFSTTRPTKKITTDQFGETEVNEYIMGATATVSVPMAETDLAKLAVVIPGSTLTTDGGDATRKKLSVPSGAGLSLFNYRQKLTCHPFALLTSNKRYDLVLPNAAPKGDFNFMFKHDEERVYSVEFTGYPDISNGGLLYILGDETVV